MIYRPKIGVAVGILACSLVITGLAPVLASRDKEHNVALDLLSIGSPGTAAIPLDAWIIKGSEAPLIRGDSLVIQFQAEEDGHLTILAVSSSGKVSVLFPCKETQTSKILKNKVYTLFGDGSLLRMILGNTVETSKLVFLITSNPVPLEPLRAAEKSSGIIVSAGDNGDYQILKRKIEQIAEDPKFNRVTISLKDEKGAGLEALLTEAPPAGRKPSKKALPCIIKSDRPASVTGAQGVRQEPDADQ